MTHINENELVYNVDKEGNIFSGGFGVNNILMKMGGSPIITLNSRQTGGGEKVSDLFNDLAVPNWAYSYRERFGNDSLNGGSDMERNTYNSLNWSNYSDDDDDVDDVGKKHIYIDNNHDDDDVENQSGGNFISDDLYNKLLGLVTVDRNGNEIQPKANTPKKKTRRFFKNKTNNKNTRRQNK